MGGVGLMACQGFLVGGACVCVPVVDVVGIYHVPLHAEYFSAFSFCLHCCVLSALSVGWKSMVPLYCGVGSLWVGLD